MQKVDSSILVSVIIPVHNDEHLVSNAIESVLMQSFQKFEIICINDASTDDTWNILNTYAKNDKRISAYNLKKNLGCPGLVRNYGITKAKGNILAFLDSDDTWKSNKLQKQLEIIHEQDSYFSYTKVENIIGTRVYEPKFYLRIFSSFLPGNLIIENTITTSTVIISKQLFINLGGFRNEKMVVSEDYELWIKTALMAKQIEFVDEILIQYNVNPNSVTNSKIGYKNIYINILKIIKRLLISGNTKYIVFAVIRFITLPLLFLFHFLILLRGHLK